MSDILKENFGDKYPFTKEEMTECPPGNLRQKTIWGQSFKLDRTKSEKILKVQYHSMKDTLVTMANGMIEAGIIPKKE